jgi:hypothetical protein
MTIEPTTSWIGCRCKPLLPLQGVQDLSICFVTHLLSDMHLRHCLVRVSLCKSIYLVHHSLTHSLMELSPSWEAANCAAYSITSQHFMELEGPLPFSQDPSTGPYSVQVRSYLWSFETSLFLRWGVLSSTPDPKAGWPPLVGCPRLLIQYIRSYTPKLEGVSSIRNLRTHHAVVTRDPPICIYVCVVWNTVVHKMTCLVRHLTYVSCSTWKPNSRWTGREIITFLGDRNFNTTGRYPQPRECIPLSKSTTFNVYVLYSRLCMGLPSGASVQLIWLNFWCRVCYICATVFHQSISVCYNGDLSSECRKCMLIRKGVTE